MTKTPRIAQLARETPILTGWDEIQAYSGQGKKFVQEGIDSGRLQAKMINGKMTAMKGDVEAWIDGLIKRTSIQRES